jgi:hypothetical protein
MPKRKEEAKEKYKKLRLKSLKRENVNHWFRCFFPFTCFCCFFHIFSFEETFIAGWMGQREDGGISGKLLLRAFKKTTLISREYCKMRTNNKFLVDSRYVFEEFPWSLHIVHCREFSKDWWSLLGLFERPRGRGSHLEQVAKRTVKSARDYELSIGPWTERLRGQLFNNWQRCRFSIIEVLKENFWSDCKAFSALQDKKGWEPLH